MRLTQISTVLAILAAPALASAQIRSPGQHAHYGAELEPHLILEWDAPATGCIDTGVGLGFRAAIPFLDNGPVPTINNNMAIGFGLDYAHYSGNYCGIVFQAAVPQITINVWDIPVVAQWNFFLTPRISVFGEPGLYIQHWSWNQPVIVAGCPANTYCGNFSVSDTSVHPAIAGGGRFLFTDSVSAMVRIGWPYISAGVGIWL